MHFKLGASIQCKVIHKEEVTFDVILHFGFCFQSLQVEEIPVKLVPNPTLPSWKASLSMARNIMLNKVGAIMQPCLAPWVTTNSCEGSPSSCTLPTMPSWNCLTKVMSMLGHPKLAHDFPHAIMADGVKGIGQVHEGGVVADNLFLRLLLQLLCS